MLADSYLPVYYGAWVGWFYDPVIELMEDSLWPANLLLYPWIAGYWWIIWNARMIFEVNFMFPLTLLL